MNLKRSSPSSYQNLKRKKWRKAINCDEKKSLLELKIDNKRKKPEEEEEEEEELEKVIESYKFKLKWPSSSSKLVKELSKL